MRQLQQIVKIRTLFLLFPSIFTCQLSSLTHQHGQPGEPNNLANPVDPENPITLPTQSTQRTKKKEKPGQPCQPSRPREPKKEKNLDNLDIRSVFTTRRTKKMPITRSIHLTRRLQRPGTLGGSYIKTTLIKISACEVGARITSRPSQLLGMLRPTKILKPKTYPCHVCGDWGTDLVCFVGKNKNHSLLLLSVSRLSLLFLR